MEREDIEKILALIKDIELKDSEIENLLLKASVASRNDLLLEITQDIIGKNKIFLESGTLGEELCVDKGDISSGPIPSIIDNLITNIQSNPSKKIIYLRGFLDRFREISDSDKNVILQSIKDEKIEDLKEKILSLIKVFEIEI